MSVLTTPLRLGLRLQALPLHKPSCELLRSTNLTTRFRCHIPLRLGRRATLPTSYAPSTSINFYSTFQRPLSTDNMQVTPGTSSDDIIFSAGQPAELPGRASKLLSTWELSAWKKGISRQYTFSTFSKAWQFMSIVAAECKAKNHHPSWSNLYNKVTVEWTTHRPEGLSMKDIEMAEFCDRTANNVGLNM